MRFPGGGMTVLSVFLLVPLGIFLVSGAARAEEESSPLSRAGAWLAGLEEQADVLRTRPELRMLSAEQERLMELLSSAENMEDLLAIESKLSEVRYELENYGSQLRMLDNQIDYSTVNVDVDEVERITETGEKSFFAEIKDRFGDSLYQVGHGIRSFVIGFLGSLPIIFVWVVIAAVVVIVVRSIRKKRKKKKE